MPAQTKAAHRAASLALFRGRPEDLARIVVQGRTIAEEGHDSPTETSAVRELGEYADRTGDCDGTVGRLAGGEAACRAFKPNGHQATVIAWIRPYIGKSVAVVLRADDAFWFHTERAPTTVDEIPLSGWRRDFDNKEASDVRDARAGLRILRKHFGSRLQRMAKG